jgi:hypothetical protein
MMSNDQLLLINLLSLAAISIVISSGLRRDQRGPPLNWEAAAEAFSGALSWPDLVPPGSIDPFLAP